MDPEYPPAGFLMQSLKRADPERILNISEPEIGLEAVIVLDNTVLGPAAGGIRTSRYASAAEATEDAIALARAMTIKCSLSGLDAGGGKAVIIEQDNWDRPAVFRRFGEIVQDLGGDFRTAGDLGTRAEDLIGMATTCEYVHTHERKLEDSVARGLATCMQALADAKKRDLASLQVTIQGCGAIGGAVARALTACGVHLFVTDINDALAATVASQVGAPQLDPETFVSSNVDVLCPCAFGGALSTANIPTMQAWGVCGGANNSIADDAAQSALLDRGVLVVPDVVASAGAVIDGIGDTVMGLGPKERTALIDQLGTTAAAILLRSARLKRSTQEVAHELAMARVQCMQVAPI
jgi:leucine dehydrogenase